MHTRGADTVTTRIKQMMKNDAESMSSLEMRVYSLVDLVVHLKKETGKQGIVRSVDEIIEYLYDPKSRQCTQHVLYRALSLIHIWDGELCNANSEDPKVKGVRQFIEDLGLSDRLDSTGLQTVGIKGYDGFTLTFVKA